MTLARDTLRQPDAPSHARLLAVTGICIGFALLILDANILNVAAPALRDALGASGEGLLWIIDGYTLAFAGLLLAAGTLADRLGAGRIFLVGLGIFFVASLGCSLCRTAPILVAARILQGTGAAMIAPTSLTLLRQLHPDAAERARALALWAAISGVAFALAPVVGGALVAAAGWQSIFVINLPLGAAGIALVRYALADEPPAPRTERPKFDAIAQALGVATLSALTFTLIEMQNGWHSTIVVCGAIGTLAAAIGFVLRERAKPDAARVVPLATLRAAQLRAALAAGAAFNFCLYGSLLALTLHLQDMRHLSAMTTGAVFLPLTALHAIVAMTITGRLTVTFGPRPTLVLGLLLCAIGTGSIALTALLGHADPSIDVILLGLGAFGIGSDSPPRH